MERLTIGQLAKQANVNLETIRYYERRGLIPEPPRNKSGYRLYSTDDLARTRFIKRTQALGFSLKEISELLSLRVEPGVTCAEVKARVEAKILDIESRIAYLGQMRKALSKLSNQCNGRGPIGKCPILEALDE
ncbi:MAG: MerR family transcriptional regulator [Deltaproteobacteria bacterium]|nr:MerR family transcriptional regulator [Deltaproteobacteria bacterium]MBW2154754.1 MerR family transcriptional regulator [Deltaproteobacteria bacterium]